MIEQLRLAVRRRPLLGAAISVAVHASLLLALFWVPPGHTPAQKRGDALIVDLPNLDEPAKPGTPGPAPNEPSAPAAPAPKPSAQPTPPTPRTAAAPRAKAARPAPAADARDVPRAVASAAQPAPAVEQGEAPTAKSAPQPSTNAETAAVDPVKPSPELSRSEPPPPAVANAPSAPPGPVAMVPPPPAPDIRSALRRGGGGGGSGSGGAGGTGLGRGGIVGEPIPLDSTDTDLQDYLERIKRLIKLNWVYPCIKDRQTGSCDYKSAELVVEFGILKQGPVQYVEVRRTSAWVIYDEFAVNAIKLASPFPPVPPAMMARMRSGSAGAAIVARFVYVYETGLTNVVR